MKKISVILPTFNELKTDVIQSSLPQLCLNPELEIIIIDKNSNDGTKEFCESHDLKFISTGSNSRAARINQGIAAATTDFLILNHPRSILSNEAIKELLPLSKQKIWGGFTHHFDYDHPLLNFTSWYSNTIRFDRSGIIYLDHCIFLHKDLVAGDKTPVPEVDIFEDTKFSLKLLKKSKPLRLQGQSKTSSVRFKKNGVWTQAIMNQALKAGYKLKVPPRLMNKIYEKGLSLNSKY